MGAKQIPGDEDIEMLERDDPMQRMPFLGSGSKVGKSVGSRFFNFGRHFRKFGLFLLILVALVFIFDTWGDAFLNWAHSDYDDGLTPDKDKGQPLHVLIPATSSNVNLCKTTLGLNVLGYPDPTFLGWDKSYTKPGMKDGGARLYPKITDALAYVETLKNDDDLVLIADGYDTWFQLPPSTLRARYFLALASADWRVRHRLGRRAIRREALKATVVFGAAKACTPNGLHTVACYPIIPPPTAKDMYKQNTDTHKGNSKHSSYRPRYLDAGFMMGYVRDVRAVLKRANELLDTLPPTEQINTPYTDGNDQKGKPSENYYHGDAQSIFARIFGEQEWQREIIRLRYRSWFKKWSPPHTPGWLEGRNFKDIIHPPFEHEKMKPMKGHPKEFGICLDYTGMLGSSTADSPRDFRALTFDGTWNQTSIPGPHTYDCKPRIKPNLPKDVRTATLPQASKQIGPADWTQAKQLWANLCLGNIPVMVHHNGKKELRQRSAWWKQVWYQADAAKMMHSLDESNADHSDATRGRKNGIGAYSQQGEYLGWRHLCPAEYDMEIFGDALDH